MSLFPYHTIEQVVKFDIAGLDTAMWSLEIAYSRLVGKRILCCQTLIGLNY